MPSVIQNKRSEKDLCLSIVSLKFPISFVTSIAVDSIVKQKMQGTIVNMIVKPKDHFHTKRGGGVSQKTHSCYKCESNKFMCVTLVTPNNSYLDDLQTNWK